MALNYYFFNAKKSGEIYDRVYTASDITDYLDGIVGSGVFPKPSNCLQVYAGTGMQVKVRPGQGWIEGHKLINTADLLLTIDAADVTLNRVDRVVFRVDKVKRIMEIVVKKGTNASSPTAPNLVRTQDMIEYSLATITINKQTSAIAESMIRDTRLDSSVCGMVQGLIQQVGTDTLFKQWNAAYDRAIKDDQADFDEWFNNVKHTLTTSTLIRSYKHKVVTERSTKSINIDIKQYVKELDILEVYVSGLRLDDSEYSIDSAGKVVTFTRELDAKTTIELVVYKTIDGSNAETVVGKVEELETRVNNAENKIKQNYTIPISAWTRDEFLNLYVADIQDSEITAQSMVSVNFKVMSISYAQAAGVLSVTDSTDGAVKLYAESVPEFGLVCDYMISKGVIL